MCVCEKWVDIYNHKFYNNCPEGNYLEQTSSFHSSCEKTFSGEFLTDHINSKMDLVFLQLGWTSCFWMTSWSRAAMMFVMGEINSCTFFVVISLSLYPVSLCQLSTLDKTWESLSLLLVSYNSLSRNNQLLFLVIISRVTDSNGLLSSRIAQKQWKEPGEQIHLQTDILDK